MLLKRVLLCNAFAMTRAFCMGYSYYSSDSTILEYIGIVYCKQSTACRVYGSTSSVQTYSTSNATANGSCTAICCDLADCALCLHRYSVSQAGHVYCIKK
jgi:hypothetical protein